ncbi:MAG: DUF4032 domain-containing protein [Candidatus Eisenbacteria bacterium]
MSGTPGDGLLEIHIRTGHPDFLDLPWAVPLARWNEACTRLVELQRGISRHEVRFVSYKHAVYAVKELADGMAEHEHDFLVRMEARDLPSVVPVGHARVRREGDLGSVLITRFLDASLPYRLLFQNPGLERYRERLIDAMAGLIVRLHLAGVYWGDCSLSNTLFRRDAGELGAYFVDAETSEMHETLSDGQRRQDLLILEENVAGELADLAAFAQVPHAPAGDGTGERIVERYQALWHEVRREVVVAPGESWRIQERVRALNALGFSVGEIELVATGEGDRLRMRTLVTDREYHRHRLHDLTGLEALEKQAELMLNEIRELQAGLTRELDRSVPLSVAAFRWQTERYEPIVRRLAGLVGRAGDPRELYCQVLEHKWFLSEQARTDVGLEAAASDYQRRFAPWIA